MADTAPGAAKRQSKLKKLGAPPAVVIHMITPAPTDGASEALSQFAAEVYSGLEGSYSRGFNLITSQWEGLEPPTVLAMAVFPREDVPRLRQICGERGLVLYRSILAVAGAPGAKPIVFDYMSRVATVADLAPNNEDIYMLVRTSQIADSPGLACAIRH